jgi:hypothetical protein
LIHPCSRKCSICESGRGYSVSAMMYVTRCMYMCVNR